MPQTKQDIMADLSRAGLFSGVDPQELEYLANRAVSRRYAAGEMIFQEGDPSTGLYVVQRGTIRIFKMSPNGREQVLGIEGPGSSVAELPVLDGGKYPASASAVSEADVLFVSRKDFQAMCLEHPEFALKVLKVVGMRLRRLVGIIEELSFTTVRHRLIAHLLRVARSEGKKTARGIEFTLPMNQQELAAQVGTVRELVSRNLSRLQGEGLIRMDGREMVITDEARLQEIISGNE